MPKPISSVKGALRPNKSAGSSRPSSSSRPYCGQPSSSPRCCPGVMRPARMTKLLISRRCAAACGDCPFTSNQTLQRRRGSGIQTPGHTASQICLTAGDHCITHGLGHQRSEEHTSELQSRPHLVCRLLLEKKKNMPLRYLPVLSTLHGSTVCSGRSKLAAHRFYGIRPE